MSVPKQRGVDDTAVVVAAAGTTQPTGWPLRGGDCVAPGRAGRSCPWGEGHGAPAGRLDPAGAGGAPTGRVPELGRSSADEARGGGAPGRRGRLARGGAGGAGDAARGPQRDGAR